MQSDRLFQAGFFALIQVLLTATMVVISWRAANGRLKRNQTTGIRTPSTMRSDQAWVAGHRAALRLTPLYLLQLAIVLTLLTVALLHAHTRTGIVVAGIVGTLLFLPVVFFTTLVAGRAAKAADQRPDDEPARPAPKMWSAKVVRLFAVANGLLLTATCVAFWVFAVRADRNGIPPNKTLGFRDDQTFASERGWYAAQRVGFHIGAVAATAITLVVFAVVAVVFVRRFHPAWALIVPVIGELAIVVSLAVAGHYADKAAASAASTAAPSTRPLDGRDHAIKYLRPVGWPTRA